MGNRTSSSESLDDMHLLSKYKKPKFMESFFCLNKLHYFQSEIDWKYLVKKRCSELENKCGWTIVFKNFLQKSRQNLSKISQDRLREHISRRKQSILLVSYDFMTPPNTSEKKTKEYIQLLNRLNDELIEVDLIENNKILFLVDLEHIFTSNNGIIQILRHKDASSKKKKENLLKEIEAPLTNYKENLLPKSPDDVGTENKKSSLLEIQNILNDLLIYKDVVKFITKDIYSEDHVFYEFKSIFNNYFLQKYDKNLKIQNSLLPIEKSYDSQEFSKSVPKAVFELQQFTRLFLEVIYFYYNIKSLLGETTNPIFSLKNLTYFLILHVFTNNTYKIIYEMFRARNQLNEAKLRQNIEFFRGVNKLKLFGVPPKYCLDQKFENNSSELNSAISDSNFKGTAHFNFIAKESNGTLDHESEFYSAKGSIERKLFLSVYSFGGKSLICEEHISDNQSPLKDLTENSDDQQFFEVNNEFLKENHEIHLDKELRESKSLSEISKDSKEESKTSHIKVHHLKKLTGEKHFLPAIQSLESIGSMKSSLNKIKIIKKTIQKIYFCIHCFYKENHFSLPNDLDHLQIVSIFFYVIVNSNITEFLTECDIIENFTLCNIFESIGGYYYVIFKLFLNFFMDFDIKKVKEYEKEQALSDLCQNILEKLRDPDEMTKVMILNIKRNVHKNYKFN